MKARAALALAVLVTSGLLAGTAASGQRQVFRSGVGTVAVYPAVTDEEGRFVPNLTKDDFQILDNGRPAEIAVFSNLSQPITATLLLDMSGSMEGRLLKLREAALQFVNALEQDDRLRIGTFGTEVALSPHLTGDKTILRRVLQEELWPGGSTPLWFAMDTAMDAFKGETGRRTIVVLTDGNDTSSYSASKIEERVRRELFMVYGIGLEGVDLDGRFNRVADNSGGAHVTLPKKGDLASAFARVAAELRHQYVVGFNPAVADGTMHTLQVRVVRRGLTVRAPKQFLAPGK